MSVVVRTSGDPLAPAGAVRRELRALDPSLPAPEFRTMERVVAESVARPRFLATLLTLFAAAALSLAAVGTYGLLSYTVAQRTREIGVRIALGARPRDVLEMVVGRALTLAGLGVTLGVGGAFALTRFLESQLFEVGAGDPATFAAVALLLAGTALLASLAPARRAARLDPMAALRAE
jgi:ABC-type antimicrobial peptide transport system permease subunit